MKMVKHQRWLAGAVCVALAACSNMDSNRSSTSMSSEESSSANNMTGTGSDYRSTNPGGSSSTTSTTTTTSTSSTQVSYGSVLSIDPMQRQDVGVGTLGAAAAGGTIGAPTDRVYRVSVRMDDGTTQTMVLDTKPSYKSGDRVRYSNGMLEKY